MAVPSIPAVLPFKRRRPRADDDRAQQRQGRHQEGEQVRLHHFRRFSWFMSTLSVLRFIITKIAKAHGDLRSGHEHDEEHEDLSARVAVVRAEGHQQQVHAVEHQLQAHDQDDDGVPPDHHAHHADAEQQKAQDQVVVQRAPTRMAVITFSITRDCR
jgi:hypothetical protein